MDITAMQGGVTPTALTGTPRTSGPSATDKSNTNSSEMIGGLGKSDFLKLLVAQLRNQDPLKPLEDKEFIAQMAQLNTLEQIMAMNRNLSDFLSVDGIARASSLIGKMVLAESNGGLPVQGVVQEVWLEQGKPVLIVDGQRVPMADVRGIASGD